MCFVTGGRLRSTLKSYLQCFNRIGMNGDSGAAMVPAISAASGSFLVSLGIVSGLLGSLLAIRGSNRLSGLLYCLRYLRVL